MKIERRVSEHGFEFWYATSAAGVKPSIDMHRGEALAELRNSLLELRWWLKSTLEQVEAEMLEIDRAFDED